MKKHTDGRKGWDGSGIDREDGTWLTRQVDDDAIQFLYGRGHNDKKAPTRLECDYDERGASGDKLLRNAREGNMPMMGKGSPESAEQTGMPKGRKDSAR